MPSGPIPPEEQAEIEELAQAIREAVEDEIGGLAADLSLPPTTPTFLGPDEFKIRVLVHRVAA
jgi:hypothetical protein